MRKHMARLALLFCSMFWWIAFTLAPEFSADVVISILKKLGALDDYRKSRIGG